MTLEAKLAQLATLSLAELREEWVRFYRSAPPRLSADLLRHAIGYGVQEKALGRRTSAPDLLLGQRKRPVPKAGTQFVRSWNGRTLLVVAEADGYRWEDRLYPSLSAIAREVTGAHWSGPRFFGLTAHG